MKLPFRAWKGKVHLTAYVFDGKVETSIENAGRITVGQMRTALMLMVTDLGREIEKMLRLEEDLAKRGQGPVTVVPPAEPGKGKPS